MSDWGQEWERSGREQEPIDEAHPETTRTVANSWIDAIITMLATVVFGLGWVVVEIERAEPRMPASLYDEPGDGLYDSPRSQERYDSSAGSAWTLAARDATPSHVTGQGDAALTAHRRGATHHTWTTRSTSRQVNRAELVSTARRNETAPQRLKP